MHLNPNSKGRLQLVNSTSAACKTPVKAKYLLIYLITGCRGCTKDIEIGQLSPTYIIEQLEAMKYKKAKERRSQMMI